MKGTGAGSFDRPLFGAAWPCWKFLKGVVRKKLLETQPREHTKIEKEKANVNENGNRKKDKHALQVTGKFFLRYIAWVYKYRQARLDITKHTQLNGPGIRAVWKAVLCCWVFLTRTQVVFVGEQLIALKHFYLTDVKGKKLQIWSEIEVIHSVELRTNQVGRNAIAVQTRRAGLFCLTSASGWSFRADKTSSLERTNNSEYPTDLTSAVLLHEKTKCVWGFSTRNTAQAWC